MEQGWILLIVLIALLIIYPFLMSFRNKKEQQKQTAMANSLKKGDYIITYSGVYGKITEISEKEIGKFITIETGEAHKNYVTVSANAVYMITNKNVEEKKGDVATAKKIDSVSESKKVSKASAKTDKVEKPNATASKKTSTTTKTASKTSKK